MTGKNNNKKYTAEFEYHEGTDIPSRMTLINSRGEWEAPGDLAADYHFSIDGKVRALRWMKGDEEHRDHDLPSKIQIDSETRRIKLLGFCQNGQKYKHPCGHAYIWLEPDGTTKDENGLPIDVDLSKIPLNLGERLTIPPFILPLILKPP